MLYYTILYYIVLLYVILRDAAAPASTFYINALDHNNLFIILDNNLFMGRLIFISR